MSSDEDNSTADSIEQLTSDQRQHVSHLQEIVGSLNGSVAVTILRDCGWDLESAVNKVLGLHETSRDSPHRTNRTINPPTPTVNLIPPNQRVLRISNNGRQGWWWMFWLLIEPIRLTWQILSNITCFFTSFLWPDPRNQVTDPVGDVERFIQYFRTTYAVTENDSSPMPNFFIGSYAQALQEAKRTLRFLIVYLHGDSHEDTKDFCTKTLLDDSVIHYLNNSEEFILWGCNIKAPEGYRVSRTLREHTYPFIGVIGLTNLSIPDYGPYTSNTLGMALLGRIEGAIKPDDLIRQLRSILDDHQGATVAARLDRRERETTARIREEQDLAYQQSLAQDRAKVMAREEELRNAQLEAEERAKAARMEEIMERARANRRACWKDRLPPAPPTSDESAVQLSIKLPNGRRISRVFSVHDSVKLLYYFVLSQEDAPSNFEIQANFPRRILHCQPEDESDLEDYVSDTDREVMNQLKGIVPPEQDITSEMQIRKRKSTDVIHDWSPRTGMDPHSFGDLGLCKPEVLFVIDNDA